MSISLEPPSRQHLIQLRASFTTAEQMAAWGGPNVRHPSTQEEFEQDIGIGLLSSFALLIETDWAGFGQFYSRLGHCHLGRLFIAPEQRGRGLIDVLIHELLLRAQVELGHSRASLFVLQSNTPAIHAYRRNHFIERAYPGDIGLKNCLYMTKSISLRDSRPESSTAAQCPQSPGRHR